MEWPLTAWESFYVIVGSSAAALTGLQFVVIVLGSELQMGGAGAATRAFGTPTVVHFCAALLISATLSAPWPSLGGPAFVIGACGLAGIVYGIRVMRHSRRQTVYVPVWEDVIWHNILPFLAYGTLLIMSFFLISPRAAALFAIAAAVLLLLFIGIHNAWDAVLYMAEEGQRRRNERRDERRGHP